MKELTREQAESLVEENTVLNSFVSHKGNETLVSFRLANQYQLEVHYDMSKDQKTYFIDNTESLPGQ